MATVPQHIAGLSASPAPELGSRLGILVWQRLCICCCQEGDIGCVAQGWGVLVIRSASWRVFYQLCDNKQYSKACVALYAGANLRECVLPCYPALYGTMGPHQPSSCLAFSVDLQERHGSMQIPAYLEKVGMALWL